MSQILDKKVRNNLTENNKKTSLKKVTKTSSYHLFSATLSTLFLLPILWATLNSFKTSAEANQQPPSWFPQELSLENYSKLVEYGEGIWVYLINSIVLSILVVLGTVIVSVTAGYGFARYNFKGKKLLFGTTLLVLMVPYATILIPLYLVMAKLNLSNTIFGLAIILVMFQLPFSVYLMRNSFEAIPKSLEEAARVDGCNTFKVFSQISIKLVTPGIATVALFAFISSWNEFLAPLIFLNDSSKYTLPLMLVNLRSGQYGVIDFGSLQAGVVMAMWPVLILYILLQRYYVSGLVSGALRE